MIKIKTILFVISFLLQGLALHSYAESHEEASSLTLAELKRFEDNGKTTTACWHYQLMQIHNYMINNPEAVATYEIFRDKKKYRNNTKIAPLSEMLKGSRLEVFETESACDLILAFRGTFQNALTVDLLQDLSFVPTQSDPDFHAGFLDVARSYRLLIKKVISDAQKKCGSRDLGITITGHSLGGSVAYTVANILDKLELGKPELVLFGAPRVVRQPSQHVDKVKAVHYYIDRDPVVLIPPAIAFRELTDEMYRFDRVSVLEPVSVVGHQLFQNHLPSEYINKMARWCEGKEKPKKQSVFTHTLRDSGFDASQRVLRSGVDAAGERLLPKTNEKGGTLPPVSESILTYFTAPDNSKGNPDLRNKGDGESFANQLACGVTHLWGSKTKAGRKYYCIKTLKINENARKACIDSCGTKNTRPGGCVRGCYDRIHQFCIGNWACKGDPLGG